MPASRTASQEIDLGDLIGSIEIDENNYPTDSFLGRLRAFDFSIPDAARFLFILPEIAERLHYPSASLAGGQTLDGKPSALIAFHTGGWSGAEDLIDTLLTHFSFQYFHTRWERGGHFYFEVPETIWHSPIPLKDEPPNTPGMDLRETIAFLLFLASSGGSIAGWQSFTPSERQHFLDWAGQELSELEKMGIALSTGPSTPAAPANKKS